MFEEPYKSTPEDRRRAWILGIVHVILAIVLAVMLFKIWPPTPWPSDKDLANNPERAKAFAECECPTPTPSPTPTPQQGTSSAAGNRTGSQPGNTISQTPGTTLTATASPTPSANTTTPGTHPATATAATTATPTPSTTPAPGEVLINIPIKIFGFCYRTSFDERLILLVIIAGILGSFVHGATSLADYIGNDTFNKSWSWFYLLRPAIGMALALVFYFVVRGGFLTTSGGAKDINPYGIAALAGLVGMFSKQATDKLSEVFSTLFRSAAGGGDDKRSGSLKPEAEPITVTDVDPKPLRAGSTNQVITVAGTSFVDGSTVFLNNAAQQTTFESPSRLTARVADEIIAAQGALKLKVVNPDGSSSPEIELIVS
jgi:hypothetical protein